MKRRRGGGRADVVLKGTRHHASPFVAVNIGIMRITRGGGVGGWGSPFVACR